MTQASKKLKIAQPLFHFLKTNPDLKAVIDPDAIHDGRINQLASNDLKILEVAIPCDTEQHHSFPEYALSFFTKTDIDRILEIKKTGDVLRPRYIVADDAGKTDFDSYGGANKISHEGTYIYMFGKHYIDSHIKQAAKNNITGAIMFTEKVSLNGLLREYSNDILMNYKELKDSDYQVYVMQDDDEEIEINFAQRDEPRHLGQAILDAMKNSSLSVFEAQIHIYNLTATGTIRTDTVSVAIASSTPDNASTDAMKAFEKVKQDVNSSLLAGEVSLMLSGNSIAEIASFLEKSEDDRVSDIFTKVTGIKIFDSLPGLFWTDNDDMLDLEEITEKIISNLCLKDQDEMDAIVGYLYANSDDTSLQL